MSERANCSNFYLQQNGLFTPFLWLLINDKVDNVCSTVDLFVINVIHKLFDKKFSL